MCLIGYCYEREPKSDNKPVHFKNKVNNERSVAIVSIQMQQPVVQKQKNMVHIVRQDNAGKFVYLHKILYLIDLLLFI